ncbi:uncharacterized protein LOC114939411 [Nylanderia fulva]|uniref:uncharacterized protein LOC114939411 n=1 Tax=Nylanderia fulva TaxID=613905 RepID=UPI0010FB54FB|nr:uncharacterized protein LOC114939411 [Nylanderia fulva]
MGAKYCRYNNCKNVIPNKPVYLMIHLKQVHDIEIPSDIKPTGLWCGTVNIKEWIWYYFYFTKVESVKCNICGTCFPVKINTNNITAHINCKHKEFHPKPILMKDVLKKRFFSIEDNQIKCIYKCKYSSPICRHISIHSNVELQQHLLNNHEINHAKTNDLFNWLMLYRYVLSFETSKCTICENMFQQKIILMTMRHFLKEHRIEFLCYLISKKLLDELEILNSDNDTEDVALPGSSSQQTDQSINQSSSKITSRLSDIKEVINNDTESVGTSVMSSYQQILNREKMLPDISEIKNSDNDTEGVGTSTISSYQQPTQELNNQKEISSSLYNCSYYDQITNSDVQIIFLQEFEDAN